MEGGFVNVRAFYREVRAPRGGASEGGGVRTGGVRENAGDYGRRHPGASLGSRPVAGDAALQDLPPVSQAFLSLGSNLGDRLAYLRAALDALGRGPSMSLTGTSKVYETMPIEVGDEQPDYLNCVAELECGLPAIELLRYCQGVESALGRERKGERAPRTLDVDVLLFGEEVIDEPGFGVPHRGVTRAFNLKGLADLDPQLHIPRRGRVEELLAEVDPSGIEELEVETLC